MTALVFIFLSAFSMAKRPTPQAPPDILRAGFIYTVTVNPLICKDDDRKMCHEEVLVSSKNKNSGEEIWKTMIVQVNFTSEKETDIQLILPTALRLIGQHQLVVTMEDQSRFILNAKTGDMIRPANTAVFDSKAPR